MRRRITSRWRLRKSLDCANNGEVCELKMILYIGFKLISGRKWANHYAIFDDEALAHGYIILYLHPIDDFHIRPT